MIKRDGYILPIKIQLKICISETKGLIIACFIDWHEDFDCGKFVYSPSQDYMILADENGFIINVTKKFAKSFLFNNDINFMEDKINIEDLFIKISDFTDE